jgi:high affinity Mn2+ porin
LGTWVSQPGKLRLGLFSNVGNSASYRQVLALTGAGTFDALRPSEALARAKTPRSAVTACSRLA